METGSRFESRRVGTVVENALSGRRLENRWIRRYKIVGAVIAGANDGELVMTLHHLKSDVPVNDAAPAVIPAVDRCVAEINRQNSEWLNGRRHVSDRIDFKTAEC